jgi:signal transduction histidine kinase
VAACAAAAHSVESACRDALDAISRHSTDIPFALLYVVRSGERTCARLVGTAALAPGTPASPAMLSLDSLSDAAIWPVREALETNRTVVVDDLSARFDPLPAGGWPLAPRCAVVVPLTTPGRDQPDGALIAGVSARHQLDTGNLDFIDLIAKHVVAGIAGGRLREEQQRDAVARAGAKRARAKQRARLKALEARFAGVLEERTRLAREIHDTLIQGLTGIALQLRAAVLQAEASSDDSLATLATLDRIADLAEKTSREARRVVWDMRPSVLSEREFVQAVESAAHRTMAGAGLVLHLTANGRGRSFPADGQAAVLRIVQEAIANVVRHAAANTIRLTMSFGVRRLRVTVVDDGRGFVVEPDFRAYGGHWGLVGMQERAEQIGASLRVRSAPGHGTTVVLSVPLPEPGATRPRRQAES